MNCFRLGVPITTFFVSQPAHAQQDAGASQLQATIDGYVAAYNACDLDQAFINWKAESGNQSLNWRNLGPGVLLLSDRPTIRFSRSFDRHAQISAQC